MALFVMTGTGLAGIGNAQPNARFDLAGPRIEARVTRAGTVLPISQVPNLQPGDKLWIHPDLPQTQSVHLLLVVAFLRGTTNPPPDGWFTRVETWNKKVREEGVSVIVPDEAQSALIFVAPETGGDFSTLRSAVKGRPGIFVRAVADLNAASFEQARIERYLEAIRRVDPMNSKAISERSAKLATTLNLKPNLDCYKEPVDEQVSCLRQTGSQTLLDDGHGQGIAAMLSNGASSDLIAATAATPLAGAGIYSAYVGAIVDAVRLMSGLHTAQYQYIPAIQFPQEQVMNLRLNMAPSFHNPKSVIVVGLPAIQKAIPPPLRPRDQHQISCLLQPNMVLPLEGAPLVFSTSFAHNLILRLKDSGEELPLKPDAYEGGLVVQSNPSARKPLKEAVPAKSAESASAKLDAPSPERTMTEGRIHGRWGFDEFEGPIIAVQQLPGNGWSIASDAQVFAGTESHILLHGSATACVNRVELVTPQRKIEIDFHPAQAVNGEGPAPANTLDLRLPLKNTNPGGYSLDVRQYGVSDEAKVQLTAYTGAVRIEALHLRAGDRLAVLTGQGLSEVLRLKLAGAVFTPEGEGNGSTLNLRADKPVSQQDGTAQVMLRDGRTVPANVTLDAARPEMHLLSKSSRINTPAGAGSFPVSLVSTEDIPVDAPLMFVIQTSEAYPRGQKVEIATEDGSSKTVLSLASGSLVLEDQRTAIATMTPLAVFGPSAFGKIQIRPVAADGTVGDWFPLGTLVRTPTVTHVACTASAASCKIRGDSLFLIDAVSGAADMSSATSVPVGFAGDTLTVPLPEDRATLYLRLRDDPAGFASLKVGPVDSSKAVHP